MSSGLRPLQWRAAVDGTRVHAFRDSPDASRPQWYTTAALCGRSIAGQTYAQELRPCRRCLERAPDHVHAWAMRCAHDLEVVSKWAERFPGAQLITRLTGPHHGWDAHLTGHTPTGVCLQVGWHPSSGYSHVRRGEQSLERELSEAENIIRRYAQQALNIFAVWGGPQFDQYLQELRGG